MKKYIKALYKSKTFWLGHALAIFGIIQANLPELRASLADYYGYVSIGVAVAVYVLRAVTKEPLEKK